MNVRPSSLGLLITAACLTASCTVNVDGAAIRPLAGGGTAGGAAASSPAPTGAAQTGAGQSSATPKPSAAPASQAPAAAPTPGASAEPGTVLEKEANNDFSTAQVVQVGDVIKGATGGDEAGDYYQITIPQGKQAGWLNLELDESGRNYVSRIDFFKSDKSGLSYESASDGTTQPFKTRLAVKPGATYFLVVDNHDEAVPYTFKLNFAPVADPAEPNDGFDTASALKLGVAVPFATFAGAGETADKDYFKVNLPAGKSKLRVKFENKSTKEEPARYRADLYKADKSLVTYVAISDVQADLDEAFNEDLEPGDYYVVVSDTDEGCSILSNLTVTAE
ncbi:MAG: pre-peptidase C-terminal domain-containing protein [Candidatus Sericytochromatia bacterium]|nr:pre-peptidase C-terminal domain-containing protein [Candidatus Sericytochromatia bacterium]